MLVVGGSTSGIGQHVRNAVSQDRIDARTLPFLGRTDLTNEEAQGAETSGAAVPLMATRGQQYPDKSETSHPWLRL